MPTVTPVLYKSVFRSFIGYILIPVSDRICILFLSPLPIELWSFRTIELTGTHHGLQLPSEHVIRVARHALNYFSSTRALSENIGLLLGLGSDSTKRKKVNFK